MRQHLHAGPSTSVRAYQPSSPRPATPVHRNDPTNTSGQPSSSQQGKPAVNLDAWSQGLLGQKQLDSVARLAELVRKSQRDQNDEEEEVGENSQQRSHKEEEEEEVNVVSSSPSTSSRKVSLPSAPITSSSALLPWLESVKVTGDSGSSNDPNQSSLANHSAALARIQAAVTQTTDLLTGLEQARINVAELLAGAKSVEETSEELREESEKRGGRAESLLSLAHQLDVYLNYYNLLPQATSFLSSPSLSLVLTPTFPLTLAQLDIGLSFIRAHPHFKDAGLYRLRFEHCITRGGNLAKMWICGRWRDLKEEAIGRLKEREKNLKGAVGRDGDEGESDVEKTLMDFSTPSILQVLYSKFVAASPELSSVLYEIQKRCPPHASSLLPPTPLTGKVPTNEEALLADYSAQPRREAPPTTSGESLEAGINTFSEFETLLTDVRSAYFDARRTILAPLITSILVKIETRVQNVQTTSTTSPLLSFTSRALALHRSILLSEALLYQEIFGGNDRDGPGQTALVDFLKTLSRDLIDRLHPRVFAESKVTTLATLARLVLDSSPGASSRGPDGGERGGWDQGNTYLLFSSQDPYDFSSVPALHTWTGVAQETMVVVAPLILPLSKDIQTRLLYRSRAVLGGGDIAGYSPRTGGDELVELVRRIVRGEGVADDKRGRIVVGRRGKRGRSSLGVGILKAAAERALHESEEHQQHQGLTVGGSGGRDDDDGGGGASGSGSIRSGTASLAPPTPRDGSPLPKVPSIELFKPPPPEILATWYTPLVRAFTILSLLHPVLNRSDFAKVGLEALEKVRGAVLRGNDLLRTKAQASNHKRANNEQLEVTSASASASAQNVNVESSESEQVYEPDELDSAMFDLRNALLLREVSASVDLSSSQVSTYDRLEERMGDASASTSSTAGLLDVGTVIKVMSSLLEGIGVSSNASSEPLSTAPLPLSSKGGAKPPSLVSDVSTATSELVKALRCKLPPPDTSSKAWMEEIVVSLRIIRRRVALYIDDEDVVAELARSVVHDVATDEKVAERIKERLSL